MKAFNLTMIIELEQGKLTGQKLLDVVIWAKDEVTARKKGDILVKEYDKVSNWPKVLGSYTLGVSVREMSFPRNDS
ncbi:hypothetical protein K1F50_01610 [Muricauda oceani]|uniref:Uncharacterized protein n=1 Tax=Flagellimonas oceani TaxID=2698672 RepID=A0A6G7J175_9FLAO|nr:hypothetical protein [Allomuricauda oceani]MBW8241478.1 hypothetical protein [Allomuricauda oceani]QII44526.1 hypothetical protein GVT53_07500 [Allomuricauda oceani]